MDKKKILLISIVTILILLGSFWGVKTFLNKDKPHSTAKAKVEQPKQSFVSKNKVKNKSSYENLAGLHYILLRSEKLEEAKTNVALLMDIQVKKPLTEDEITRLGKEAYLVLSKEINEKQSVSSIFINVFNNKEAFEKTLRDDYNGGYVEGFLQSYSSSHKNGNKAMVKNYKTFSLDANYDDMKDTLDFDVINANESDDGTLIDADVIISDNGDKNAMEDMVQSLSSMIKESNEGARQVSLRIFNSFDDFQNNQMKYEYSTMNPTVLVQHTYSEF